VEILKNLIETAQPSAQKAVQLGYIPQLRAGKNRNRSSGGVQRPSPFPLGEFSRPPARNSSYTASKKVVLLPTNPRFGLR
jgi:hypothetical protein